MNIRLNVLSLAFIAPAGYKQADKQFVSKISSIIMEAKLI